MIQIKQKHLIKPALPNLEEIIQLQAQLQPYINYTPVCTLTFEHLDMEIVAKMEIWQQAGSFKIRGAIYNLLQLKDEQRHKGIVAASAGNHALAVSLAGKQFNTQVKLVMPKGIAQDRVEQCQRLGADVIFAENFQHLFALAKQIEREEMRTFIHPCEGYNVTMATATIGVELMQQTSKLDAVVVAVGGGGLMAGIAYSIKKQNPLCKVFAVEPDGAPTLANSFLANKPIKLTHINSIAKSLSAPEMGAYSFAVCSRYIDGIVTVSDDEIKTAMLQFFQQQKLALEPAAATSLAALNGPLNKKLKGKRVGLILCGSNMSYEEFLSYKIQSCSQL